MKIYIDNNEVKANYSKNKNISSVVNDLSKKLEIKNRIVKNIYLNGIDIYKHNYFDSERDNILEIETESSIDETIYFLNECKEAIQEFLEYFENFRNETLEWKENATEYSEELVYMLQNINDITNDAYKSCIDKKIKKKLENINKDFSDFFIISTVYFDVKKFDDLLFFIETEVLKKLKSFIRAINRHNEALLKKIEINEIFS